MKTTIQALAAAITLIASSAAHAQEAVQWRVADGGNGHWYQYEAALLDWPVAQQRAAGRGAHLVTITSQAEYQFIRAALGLESAYFWLGGLQQPNSCEPGCGWRWITDEPWDYVNWNPGEPSNSGGNENWLECYPSGGWNDRYPGLMPSLVEWSADCNGDGIVDYGQILDGTFPDANSNGVPDCCDGGESCTPCTGDVASDGMVDGVDLAAVLSQWGTQGSGTFNADIDGSGLVDGGDLALVLGGWGPCPQ